MRRNKEREEKYLKTQLLTLIMFRLCSPAQESSNISLVVQNQFMTKSIVVEEATQKEKRKEKRERYLAI